MLIDDRPGLVDPRRERTEVGAEQRPDDDGAREPHHLFADVHRASGCRERLPLGRGVSGCFGHYARQRRHALTMKGGLGDAPLAQPEIVLARQQAVAEEQPQFSVKRTLVIVARVVLQDVTNVVWIGDEVTAPVTDFELGDITESASGLHEDADRIASNGRKHAEDRHAPRPRRKRVCGIGRLFHRTTRL